MKVLSFLDDHNDYVSASVTFLAILLYVFVSAQFYIVFENVSLGESNLYNTFEAVGALFMGFLSDKFCRRKVCLLGHLAPLLLLPFLIFGKGILIFSLIVGFFYNPLPILRAGLIDNMPHLSKIKIIALSFVIQYIPWAIYEQFAKFTRQEAFSFAFLLVLVSFSLCFFFFHDRRDKKLSYKEKVKIRSKIHSNAKDKLLFTIFAAIPSQLVYFLSDNLLESYSEDVTYYSILSFGSLIGALVASLYKKTPHVAVLTINYGISMVLAAIPISAIFLYHFNAISFPLMFIIFGCLGGFGIPFIYDVVLNSTFVNYRGTACGLLDTIFSISSLINSFLVTFLNLKIFWTLALIPIFFALSTFLQKKAERD